MLVYRHNCGGVAFHWHGPMPAEGDTLIAANATHVDGSPVVNGSPVRCDACGQQFLPVSKNLEAVSG